MVTAPRWDHLNPTDNDDTNRAAIVQQIENVTPLGGTPLMEALQDVWQDGYYGRRNVLDSLLCRKNYVISMTDGYPSVDTDASRIPLKGTFTDADGDGWTSDPYQGNVKPNFYDDVAHWMYTHSWLDGSEVTDPANSYTNVMTHHIAFGAKQPLLEDAAGESGGEYIVAYNKEQLIAAFYSLALMMSEAVSFTAPVVSVDAVNKIQSGDDLYMGLFLPMDSTYWVGNVKKFKMGDGSAERPELFNVYDKKNAVAIDGDGHFLDNTATFWGTTTTPTTSTTTVPPTSRKTARARCCSKTCRGISPPAPPTRPPTTSGPSTPGWTTTGTETRRWSSSTVHTSPPPISRWRTTPPATNWSTSSTATPTTRMAPPARRWPCATDSRPDHPFAAGGHRLLRHQPGRPAAAETADRRGQQRRMLHVFDDETGRELFAFIPEDILPKLKEVQANTMFETVDGPITLFRRDKAPKYLIFGERRGGSFLNLDIPIRTLTQWTVAWSYTHPEIQQSGRA